MASSSSTSHRITPHNAYNWFPFSRSAFTPSLALAFIKRLTSFCGAASGAHNSHPVHHVEPPTPPPPSSVIDINSHHLSSSVSLTVNSNPINDSQENNQKLLRTQSFPFTRRIQLVPDNAVPGLRMYANTNQLVLQCNVINIQMMQSDQYIQVTRDRMIAPNTGTSLGKTFLGLTYQAAIGFALFHYQSLSSSSSSSDIGAPSVPLHIVAVATVVGFAASLIGILLREPCPIVAAIVEKFGYVSAALGFFVMMGVFLPSISQWIGWVSGIGCFIAFVFNFLKVR